MWNYWLGGKDSYPVDQEAAKQFLEIFPGIVPLARWSRAFLAAAVRHLTSQGHQQFLDLGCGLPTTDNLHQIAQRITPTARFVYLDNDPLVTAHGQALLTSTTGPVDNLRADLNDGDTILKHAGTLLALHKPIVVVASHVLGHIDHHARAVQIIGSVMDRLAPGSTLILCDRITGNPDHEHAQHLHNATTPQPYRLATPEQLADIFGGLTLIDPQFAPTTHQGTESAPPAQHPPIAEPVPHLVAPGAWRPEADHWDRCPDGVLCGVAVKRSDTDIDNVDVGNPLVTDASSAATARPPALTADSSAGHRTP